MLSNGLANGSPIGGSVQLVPSKIVGYKIGVVSQINRVLSSRSLHLQCIHSHVLFYYFLV